MLLAFSTVDRWLPVALMPVLAQLSARSPIEVSLTGMETHVHDGKVVLHGVKVGSGAQASDIAHLYVDLSWPDLLHGRLHLKRIRMEGANLHPPALMEEEGATREPAGIDGFFPLPVDVIEVLFSRLHPDAEQTGSQLDVRYLRLHQMRNGLGPVFRLQTRLALSSVADHALMREIKADGRLSLSPQDGQLSFEGSLNARDMSWADGDSALALAAADMSGLIEFAVQQQGWGLQVRSPLSLSGIVAGKAGEKLRADRFVFPLDLHLASASGRLAWRLGGMELAEAAQLSLELQRQENWQQLLLSRFSLSGLDSLHPDAATAISLELGSGKDQHIGLLKGEGEIQPLLDPLQAKMKLHLDLEAAPFSSLAEGAIGLRFDSGRLLMAADVTPDDGQLIADTHLSMRRLRVSQADAGLVGRMQEVIGVSPDAALDLLRDSNDLIELDIPISWRMTDSLAGFQADLSSIYARAATAALQKAALSYVKNLFQPYGTVIDAAMWLGKQSQRMRLSPVFFLPEKEIPEQESAAELDKMADFLKLHEKLTVALCGVVSGTEASGLGHADRAWEKLAAERRLRVMEEFSSRGVKRSQMTLCRSRLDESKRAKPRVEVLL